MAKHSRVADSFWWLVQQQRRTQEWYRAHLAPEEVAVHEATVAQELAAADDNVARIRAEYEAVLRGADD